MLDDITIAGLVGGLEEVPDGFLLLDRVRGRPDKYGVALKGGVLFLTFSPETKVITIRISVPRWVRPQPVNYPLVAISSVDDLRLDAIALEVSRALRLKLWLTPEIRQALPLATWAVIRSSHAVDLEVPDPLRTIAGTLGLKRRHEGKRGAEGQPVSTVQWQSRSLRVKFYAKGLELKARARKARQEEAVELLEAAADRAGRTLRFETSFLEVRSLRGLFKWRAPFLPTLALMTDPVIDRWIITREADRLRLYDDYSDNKRVFFPDRVRHVGSKLLEAQRALATGERSLGRRKTLTRDHLWDLAAMFFLGSGYKTDELARISGRSHSALAEMLTELRELGVSPDSSISGTTASSVETIMTALDPHLLEAYPPSLSHWRGKTFRVKAPWVEDEPEDIVPPSPPALDDDLDALIQEIGIGAT